MERIALAVSDDLRRIQSRHRDALRNRAARPQQAQVDVELPLQIRFAQHLQRRRTAASTASRLIGVTAAAALMLRMIGTAAWSSTGRDPRRAPLLIHPWLRQSGSCASSNCVRYIGSPRFTCTRPKRSRSRAGIEPGRGTDSFSLGLPDSSDYVAVGLHDPLIAEIHRHEHDRPHRLAQVARTVMDDMPVLGASSRPVRLRPPSMKYSTG